VKPSDRCSLDARDSRGMRHAFICEAKGLEAPFWGSQDGLPESGNGWALLVSQGPGLGLVLQRLSPPRALAQRICAAVSVGMTNKGMRVTG
jgi:hypothetical protein